MRTLAAEKKLCTQMGNQGTAKTGFRRLGVELIRSGGALRSGRSRKSWSGPTARSGRKGSAGPRVPRASPITCTGMNSSVRPHDRPHHPELPTIQLAGLARPRHRRGACATMSARHTISNVAAMALLGFVRSRSRSKSSTLRHRRQGRLPRSGRSFAPGSHCRNGRGPVTLTWFDGMRKAPGGASDPTRNSSTARSTKRSGKPPPRSGLLLIGEKGSFFSRNDYGAEHILLPRDKFKEVEKPKPSLQRSPGHFTEWVDAIKAGDPKKAMSNFEYSARLTEARPPRRRRTQGGHHNRVGPRGDESQKRTLRRSIHPARISQRLLNSLRGVSKSRSHVSECVGTSRSGRLGKLGINKLRRKSLRHPARVTKAWNATSDGS